jgi:hypothetical protein
MLGEVLMLGDHVAMSATAYADANHETKDGGLNLLGVACRWDFAERATCVPGGV